MELKYVGFWLRTIAASIDTVLIYSITSILSYALMFSSYSLFKIMIIGFVAGFFLDIIYETYLTHKYGGTVGKLLIKSKVTDEKGKNLSLWKSFLRYWAKYISFFLLGMGFLMIAWDEKKQGLHDKIVKTYVQDNTSSKFKYKKLVIILRAYLVRLKY